MTSDSAPIAPRSVSRAGKGDGVWGRRLISLAIVATLFGAIWNFGATSTASALFWLPAQFGCAALCLWVYRKTTAPTLFANRILIAAAAMFALVVLAAVLTLTPLPAVFGQGAAASFAPGTSSVDPYATGVEAARLLGLSALFICGYLQGGTRRDGEFLFALLTAGGAAFALWSIGAFIQHPDQVHGVIKHIHASRLTGSFFSANTTGALFGCLSSALAVRLIRRGRRLLVLTFDPVKPLISEWTPVLVDLAFFLLMWSAMMLTQSRAAIGISLAVIGLFAVLDMAQVWRETESRRLRRGVVLTGAGVVAILVVATLSARLLGRLGEVSTDSASRAGIFEAYRPMLAHTPPFGYGLGGFAELNAHMVTETNAPSLWNLGAAHNIFLQWWLEGGPVGLALIVLAVAILLAWLGWRFVRSRADRWRAGAALAASGVLVAHSAVDFPLQIAAVTAVWALLLGWGAAEPVAAEELRAG